MHSSAIWIEMNNGSIKMNIFRGRIDRDTGGVGLTTILEISKLCIGLEKAAVAAARSAR